MTPREALRKKSTDWRERARQLRQETASVPEERNRLDGMADTYVSCAEELERVLREHHGSIP